jgi:protein SCO1/2
MLSLKTFSGKTVGSTIQVLLFLVMSLSTSTSANAMTANAMTANAMTMPSAPPISGTAAAMGGTILDEKIPTAILALGLKDGDGKSFTLGSLKGKTVILTDFFTSCDMICPMTTANMRTIGNEIFKAGLSKKFSVLELSIDPIRDTVSRISAYQKLYGDFKPSWMVATGSRSGLNSLWAYFGVYVKMVPNVDGVARDWQNGKKIAYDVEHQNVVILIDPHSHFRWIDLGNPSVASSKLVPTKLKQFLSKQGRLNLLRPQKPDWNPGSVFGAIFQVLNLQVGPKMSPTMNMSK